MTTSKDLSQENISNHCLKKKRLNEICAKHTGQELKRIEKDTDRDNFMSAVEAVNYGLIDKVIYKHKR